VDTLAEVQHHKVLVDKLVLLLEEQDNQAEFFTVEMAEVRQVDLVVVELDFMVVVEVEDNQLQKHMVLVEEVLLMLDIHKLLVVQQRLLQTVKQP
jgi:hypothetical protein